MNLWGLVSHHNLSCNMKSCTFRASPITVRAVSYCSRIFFFHFFFFCLFVLVDICSSSTSWSCHSPLFYLVIWYLNIYSPSSQLLPDPSCCRIRAKHGACIMIRYALAAQPHNQQAWNPLQSHGFVAPEWVPVSKLC